MFEKTDYTVEQNESLGCIAGVLLAMAAVVCSGCLILSLAFAAWDIPNKPWDAVIGCILMFATFTAATGWMAIRLIRKQRSENGITTMPVVFIQICGLLFFTGLVFTAIQNQNLWIGVESLGVACAMIFIRSRVKKRQIEQSVEINN